MVLVRMVGGFIGWWMSDKIFWVVMMLDEFLIGSKKLVVFEGVLVLLCYSFYGIFVVSNICSYVEELFDCGWMCNGWIVCLVYGVWFDLEMGLLINLLVICLIVIYEVCIVGEIIEVVI